MTFVCRQKHQPFGGGERREREREGERRGRNALRNGEYFYGTSFVALQYAYSSVLKGLFICPLEQVRPHNKVGKIHYTLHFTSTATKMRRFLAKGYAGRGRRREIEA